MLSTQSLHPSALSKHEADKTALSDVAVSARVIPTAIEAERAGPSTRRCYRLGLHSPRPQCISIFIGKSTALSVARGSIEIHDDERIIITLPTVNVRVLLADAMGRLIDAYIPIEAPRYPFPAFVEFEAVVRRHDHDPIDHWQLGHYLP